jgi:hypothetical protein
MGEACVLRQHSETKRLRTPATLLAIFLNGRPRQNTVVEDQEIKQIESNMGPLKEYLRSNNRT